MSNAQQTANNLKSVKLDTQIENVEKCQIMQKFAEPELSPEKQLECDFDYSKYVEHPTIATYPKMGKEEFLGFIEDVQMNGQIDAIIINEKNEIIDGRSRYEACKITGQIPHFKLYDDIEDNIQLYWVSKNLQRTHLSVSQKACLATEVQEYYAEIIKQGKSLKISKRRNGIPLTEDESKKVTTRDTISSLFRVNPTYCDIARNLKKYEYDVFTEVKLGRIDLKPEAEEILKRNANFILNVTLIDKYKIIMNSKLDLNPDDFELIDAEKQKGGNLKDFINKLIDNKLQDPDENKLPISKIKHIPLSELGGVRTSSSNISHEEAQKAQYSKPESENSDNEDTPAENENEEKMINDFDNIDRNVKIRFIRLSEGECVTATYYLETLLNKSAA